MKVEIAKCAPGTFVWHVGDLLVDGPETTPFTSDVLEKECKYIVVSDDNGSRGVISVPTPRHLKWPEDSWVCRVAIIDESVVTTAYVSFDEALLEQCRDEYRYHTGCLEALRCVAESCEVPWAEVVQP